MGLSRPAFAEIVGIKPKRLENIENGWQKMHDEDFEKVCSVFEEFSRWIAYEGAVDRQPLELKVADSAQKAAVYLVKCNPELLKSSGISLEDWKSRHQAVLDELSDSEDPAG